MADMQIIFLTKPFPKERPRVTRNGHAFTPQRTRDYEAKLVAMFKEMFPNHVPIEGPVSVEIDIAVDMIRVDINKVDHKPKGMRGDLDNYVKAVMDALNGTAIEDDRQVVEITARKVGL